jgi:hypothetical protein
MAEPSFVTDDPDRVFADRRGVTWHLHVLRRFPALEAELALKTGGMIHAAPPGLYFAAHSGETAISPCPPAWLLTPEAVAALTWGELLALLERAHHSPAPDPAGQADLPF